MPPTVSRTRAPEKSDYPRVAKWLADRHRCFLTASNVGIRHSRADVLGVRDVGGDLSGEIELVSVEVKADEPFATATGQALGYRIYAHRVYLADRRAHAFTHEEIQIASHLGVGLLKVSPTGRVSEELSSPHHQPIASMSLRVLENVGLLPCALCRTFFRSGDGSAKNKFATVARENLKLAFRAQRGLMFWNREAAQRKHKKKIRLSDDGTTYERRFICPDCIEYVVKPVAVHVPG